MLSYANLNTSLQTGRFGFGDFNAKFTEYVVAPTGHYDVNSVISVDRNYWAFDTQLGLTWFHEATGTEISVLPGIMFNTNSTATDITQFVMPSLASGVQGYWYKQVDGDSGSGAVLGPFMGESFGLGPALLWVPESTKGKFVAVLSGRTTSRIPTA